MNPTILAALIGAVGLFIGAILSFVASAYLARQKIRELELAYRQRLDENINTNARLHLDDLYIPLTVGLTKLENRYDELMATYHGTADHPGQSLAEMMRLLDKYHQDCKEFIEQISELYGRGMDAYLSSKIDRHLHAFVWFIEHSLEQDAWVTRQWHTETYMHEHFPKEYIEEYYKKSKKEKREMNLLLQHMLKLMAIDRQDMDKIGISRRNTEEKIRYTATSCAKEEYGRQLKYGIFKLKFLIKEVTIGTLAKPLLP